MVIGKLFSRPSPEERVPVDPSKVDAEHVKFEKPKGVIGAFRWGVKLIEEESKQEVEVYTRRGAQVQRITSLGKSDLIGIPLKVQRVNATFYVSKAEISRLMPPDQRVPPEEVTKEIAQDVLYTLFGPRPKS